MNTKEFLLADLNYQHYFEPSIEDLRESFIEKICVDAERFLDDYHSWLDAYETK
jgi:hypothetical protein